MLHAPSILLDHNMAFPRVAANESPPQKQQSSSPRRRLTRSLSWQKQRPPQQPPQPQTCLRQMELNDLEELLLYGLYKQALHGDSNAYHYQHHHHYSSYPASTEAAVVRPSVSSSTTTTKNDDDDGEKVGTTWKAASSVPQEPQSQPAVARIPRRPRLSTRNRSRRRRSRRASFAFSRHGLARQKVWNTITQMVPNQELQQAFEHLQQAMSVIAKATQLIVSLEDGDETRPSGIPGGGPTHKTKTALHKPMSLPHHPLKKKKKSARPSKPLVLLQGIVEESESEPEGSAPLPSSSSFSPHQQSHTTTTKPRSNKWTNLWSQTRRSVARSSSASSFFLPPAVTSNHTSTVEADPTTTTRLPSPNGTKHETTNATSLSPTEMLFLAVAENDERTVRALLSQNQKSNKNEPSSSLIEATDEHGQSALHVAAHHGHVDMVQCLHREFGAKVLAVDDDGISVLQTAVIAGQSAVCAYLLLEAGADPDQPDLDGDTPRLCALDEDSDASIRQLLEHATPRQSRRNHKRRPGRRNKPSNECKGDSKTDSTKPTTAASESNTNGRIAKEHRDDTEDCYSPNDDDSDDSSEYDSYSSDEDSEYSDDDDFSDPANNGNHHHEDDDHDSCVSWTTDFSELPFPSRTTKNKAITMVVDQVPSTFQQSLLQSYLQKNTNQQNQKTLSPPHRTTAAVPVSKTT